MSPGRNDQKGKKDGADKASKNRNRIVEFPRHCDSGAGPSMKPA
jgi:hypothetical protein